MLRGSVRIDVAAKAGCRRALIVVLCSCSVALAADEREPIRLTYAADAGCPSASDFEASVLERTRRARPAGKTEIAREYRIVVRTIGKKSVARLEFPGQSGGTVGREVAADSCAEAVAAIAIVTALAFDAAAAGLAESEGAGGAPSESQSNPGAGATPAVGERAPPAASPGTPRARRPAPKPAPTGAREPAPDLDQEPARDALLSGSRPARSERRRLELGARATLTSPKAPTVLPGAELFGSMADPGLVWLLHLGVAGERGFRLESGPGEARFSFLGGRLEGCFFGVAFNSAFVLRPCVLFEAGAVFAEGFIQGQEATHVDPWYALGLNARLSVELGWATAVLEAGPTFPLRPDDRVVFGDVEDPLQEVHDVPYAGAFVSLGLSFGVP